jgi:hypothetical protein
MVGQIPRPFPSIALVATLLIAGVSVTARPTTARADDCLTAPNSPAPQGTHWYYRSDRATQRKCWYVRAPGQPAQQVAAATTGPATPLHSRPAPTGAPSPNVSAPPSPRVQTSAAEPTPTAAPGGTTDKTVQQSAPEEATASTPVVPAPQTSPLSETGPQAAAPPAVTWPDAAVALAGVKAQEPTAVPTDARAESMSDDAQRTVRRTEPSKNGGMLMIIFPVLALGLAGVGILSRVVIKNAAASRTRIIADHLEPDRVVDDQRRHKGRDDQYPRGGQELHSLVLVVSDPGPLRNDTGAFQSIQEKSERRDKLLRFCRDIERMLQSPASPQEEPLRGQAAA